MMRPAVRYIGISATLAAVTGAANNLSNKCTAQCAESSSANQQGGVIDCGNKAEDEKPTPIDFIQKRLDSAGVPIDLRQNAVRNFLAISGVVLYWSSMWNILDEYFFIKTIPNPIANSALRILVGVGMLAFPDDDIKELGDKWQGLDDDDEDTNGSVDSLSREQLSRVAAESITLGLAGAHWNGDDTVVSRESLPTVFRQYDTNDDRCADELKIVLSDFLEVLKMKSEASRLKAQDAKERAEEEEEAEVDRFRDIEDTLKDYGISLDLHNAYFHNFWLGTGIIVTWSGLENMFKAIFDRTSFLPRNVFANNAMRITLAAMILYLPSGNLNDMGDGYLEDEDEIERLSEDKLRNAIADVAFRHELLQGLRKDEGITLAEAYDLFDAADIDGNRELTSKELVHFIRKLYSGKST